MVLIKPVLGFKREAKTFWLKMDYKNSFATHRGLWSVDIRSLVCKQVYWAGKVAVLTFDTV